MPPLTRTVTLSALLAVAGCLVIQTSLFQDDTGLEFRRDGTALVVNGVVDSTTPDAFSAVLADHPDIDTLILQQIDGSADDDANLTFSAQVRAAGLNTHVPADGMIASGGTDLFLAGVRRTLAPGACVGVHSWSDGTADGRDLPRDDPSHQLYLTYYADMGIDPNFYWFTLNAAAAADMHWTTAAEATRHGLTTQPSPPLSSPDICDQR